MCVGVCLTRRGMVYFGASVHIFVTFVLFIGSSIRAIQMTSVEKEDSRKETLGAFIIATYFFVLLMLGCLIFRATEQKNAKLLGWTGGIFITLETFAFVMNLLILSPMGSTHDEYGFRNFGFSMNLVYLILSCVFLLCMMGYCATIIMYISKLKEDGGHSVDAEPESASRISSRTASTFFRSQSQNQMEGKAAAAAAAAFGGGGGGAAGFNILEVVKEAKRQQQLKEQKELREKQRQEEKQRKKAEAAAAAARAAKSHSPKPSSSRSNTPKPSSRPHTPHLLPAKIEAAMGLGKTHASTGTDMTADEKETSVQIESQPERPSSRLQKPSGPSTASIGTGTATTSTASTGTFPTATPPAVPQKPGMRCQEQQTQTPPPIPFHSYPHPHPLPPPPPTLSSQTLPPRRTQLQAMHHQYHPNHVGDYERERELPCPPSRPYFLQHDNYTQRGILSAPSFASIPNTASVIPHRFRNPAGALRTTKSGTLLPSRYESMSPPPRLPREASSSCSSFDPLTLMEMELDWETPRVKATAGGSGNYHYNALRRGTHRNDYGLGVEV